MQDCYKSILEAFIHAGAANETKVNVISIHSEHLDPSNIAEKLAGLDGVLVAPGFGERGIEGKIEAVRYVRENNIPFFGIYSACASFVESLIVASTLIESDKKGNAICVTSSHNLNAEKQFAKKEKVFLYFL